MLPSVAELKTTTYGGIYVSFLTVRARRWLNELAASVRPKQWSCTSATCTVCERVSKGHARHSKRFDRRAGVKVDWKSYRAVLVVHVTPPTDRRIRSWLIISCCGGRIKFPSRCVSSRFGDRCTSRASPGRFNWFSTRTENPAEFARVWRRQAET